MASQTVAPFLRLTNPIAQDIGNDFWTREVQFERLVNFKITSKFTIALAPNDFGPYDDNLAFFIKTQGGRGFALKFQHESQYEGYLQFGIYINDGNTPKSCFLLPREFLGRELTLEASYTRDTNIISVSLSDGSQTVVVSIIYDLSQFITGSVEVGFIPSSTKVSVSYYDFTFTGSVGGIN